MRGVLGRGTFGVVKKGEHRITKKLVAIKMFRKKDMGE